MGERAGPGALETFGFEQTVERTTALFEDVVHCNRLQRRDEPGPCVESQVSSHLRAPKPTLNW
jgi:hypothetical protein